MNYPLCKVSGLIQGSSDRDDPDSEEVVFSTTAKLPSIDRIPPYTSWIFLDRYELSWMHLLFRVFIAYDQLSVSYFGFPSRFLA